IADKKKGQLFSKLSKLISLAARKGTNPETNIELKNAVEQARSFDMPRDNIERAIKKVSDKSAVQLEELNIESLGPGGIALKIKAITDSRNRTISEVKHLLSENDAKIAEQGSVLWSFEKAGGKWQAKFPQQISEEGKQKLQNLVNALEERDDVQNVITNSN
ncbi:MAG: YebC/PmpR family DNA-binding transcriptional regulator, partial [Patescibacteria group bacterium]